MSWRFRGFLLIFASASLAGQSPTEPIFHATTKLIQVSVIAQDNDGKPVADLKREDFQIFDNGKPQPIQLFIAEKPAPPGPQPVNTFTNKLARSTGYSVLLFDSNSSLWGDTAHARLLALKALQEISPDDKIAIYSLWCRFRVVREFSSDRESLVGFLNNFKPAASACVGGGDEKEVAREAIALGPKAAAEVSRITALENDSATDQEIQHMADHLAGVPGRKNLIWLADGFPLSPAGLRKLIDAGVAVYPGNAKGSTIAVASEKRANAIPLMALAAMTGGAVKVDEDDIDVFIRKALDDGRTSYTLGFYQTNDDKPPTPGHIKPDHVKPDQAEVHQIGVRVRQPGLTLRYRKSYAAEPPAPVSVSPVANLVKAMNSPADATAIGITATVTRTGDRFDLKATVDLSNLDLGLSEGLRKGNVEFIARFLTAQAVQAGEVVSDTATIKLSDAPYRAMLKSGFVYHKELAIPLNAAELKLVVGNLASGKIGTVTIPLSEVKGK